MSGQEAKKYIHFVGLVVVLGVVYSGVSISEGINVELEQQPCAPEGTQRLVFKDGEHRLARINQSAIADLLTSDETIDGFVVLNPEEVVETGTDAPDAGVNE